MNDKKIFKIKASFEANVLIIAYNKIELVKDDYNSIVFLFDFDVLDGRKFIEIKKPDGTVWIKEIINNQVTLVDKDENGKLIPIITQAGLYDFEITLYKDNSKLTIREKGSFHARDEVVCDDDEVAKDGRLPILGDLLNEVGTLKENCNTSTDEAKKATEAAKTATENANKKVEEIENKVSNGDFNGATFIPNIDEEGNLSWNNDKALDNPETVNIRGPQGPQGVQGEAFAIKKTYSSKEEMNADFANMAIGDYVMITSNVEVEDNAKLYSKGVEAWVFITDFSGATGIQGPQGIQGIQGIQGPMGPKPVVGVDYFTEQDKVQMVSSITEDANSIFNQNATVKTTEFNTNASSKLEEFNTNATNKTTEFNANTEQKINEYNNNSESLANCVVDTSNEIENLKNAIFEEGIASDSFIHLEDSAKLKFKELSVDGVCKQETTVGRNHYVNAENLQIKDDNPYGSSEILATYDGYNNVIHIKQAVDFCKIADDAVSDTFLNSTKVGDSVTVLVLIKKAQDVTARLYYNSQAGSGNYHVLEKYKDLNNSWAYYYSTFTFSDSATEFTPKLHFKTNGEAYIAKIQLSLGDTVKDFEPYTGGQSSPNQAYRQPIEVIEGSFNLTVDNGKEANAEDYLKNQTTVNLGDEFVGKIDDTYKDTLKIKFNQIDGKYHSILNKMVGRVTVDETSNCEFYKVNDNGLGVFRILDLPSIAEEGNNKGISTHFKFAWNINSNEPCFYVNQSINAIYLITTFTNIDELKIWLSENNVTFYYKLAEPYEVDLGVVDMPCAFDRITNIFTDSALLPIINVKYHRDLRQTIENQQLQIDELKTLLSSTATSSMLLDNYQSDLESEV